MSGIQILLISGVVLVVLYYLLRLRSALLDLIVLFAFSVLAIYSILFPEYTNSIAHKLGVGRGADLLFYICILLFLFISMKLFSRIRRLERLLTQIIRTDAKENAILTEMEKHENDGVN